MRTDFKLFSLLLLALGSINFAYAGDNTYSGRAVQDSVKASSYVSRGAAGAIIASGQVVSAAAAVPLAIGGSVMSTAGKVSTGLANGSMRAATAMPGRPLDVTDETITVMPPNEALKTKP